MGVLDKEQIKNIIPHRDPFLLVDEVLEIQPGEYIKAVKYVRQDEYYFEGHFPSNPIMPGVLMVESIAQAGAIALLALPQHKGKIALFAGIDKVRFKSLVKPPETMEIEVECLQFRKGMGKARGVVKVKGKIACKAEIMFALQ
jgi:3-hydroxyacyl-[acyl-carrier-protein] dehydratase